MVRKTKKVGVDKSKADNFLKVSANFEEAARLAYEFDYYNAAGVLVVHAAIALADSITIKFGGIKSRSENHLEIINLIREVVRDEEQRNKALNQLEALISHKSSVSYSGDIYHKKDIDKMLKHYERFSSWAKSIAGLL